MSADPTNRFPYRQAENGWLVGATAAVVAAAVGVCLCYFVPPHGSDEWLIEAGTAPLLAAVVPIIVATAIMQHGITLLQRDIKRLRGQR